METNRASVYNFQDPRDYIQVAFKYKQLKNPSFSVRAWARQMGLKHHALLAAVMAKKRILKANLSCELKPYLQFTDDSESRYFDLLVSYANSTRVEEKKFYLNLMQELLPKNQVYLDLDILPMISEWEHSAVLELYNTIDFEPNPHWIAKRLNISTLQSEKILERLIRLGLLQKDSEGKFSRQDIHFKSVSDVPNNYIRHFHKQMLQKAQQALDNQAVAEREFRGLTLAIDSQKISEAQKLIRDFVTKFNLQMGAASPLKDQVFQLNIQFFSLTGGGNELSPKNNKGEIK
ncbi:MAG TPA: DUF4423 domain-containing protein [Pseudobdellovibrionaceae bacterium]|nr:DUF4423 domain-containing protein [Pseudobdellovibrionaceae bacterium]